MTARSIWRTNFLLNWKIRLTLIFGKFLFGIETSKQRWKTHKEFHEKSQSGPLTDAQIQQQTNFQVTKVDKEVIGRSYEVSEDLLTTPLEQLSIPKRGLVFLDQLLKRPETTVSSIANIGARVDIVSAFLARKYPQMTFTSVDFQPNLKEHNQFLKPAENWGFMSGYALDLIKSGSLKADLYYFSSTGCFINNVELNEYLDELARQKAYTVFNEPWFPALRSFNPFTVLRPEEIAKETPMCTGSGSYYHHNYVGKLENRGYTVFHSELIAGDPEYTLQVAAAPPGRDTTR